MFYGDNIRWFIATAKEFETGKNPSGKIKIRVAGLHSESVEDKYLPWADTLLPVTEGGTSGINKIPQIQPGAQVFGIFLDGKRSQSPLILGVMNKDEIPSSVQRREIFEDGGGVNLSAPSTNTSNVRIEDYPPVNLNQNLVTLYADGTSDTNTRRMIIMQHLINNGITNPKAAAGIVGNLEAETSTFNPEKNFKGTAKNPEDSWGLAQWNNDANRLQPLIDYSAVQTQRPGKDWKDFFVQLNFLIVDMKTNEWERHRVWSRLSDPSIPWDFKGEKDNFNSTWYFQHNYEIAAQSTYEKREKFAIGAYDQYIKSINHKRTVR